MIKLPRAKSPMFSWNAIGPTAEALIKQVARHGEITRAELAFLFEQYETLPQHRAHIVKLLEQFGQLT